MPSLNTVLGQHETDPQTASMLQALKAWDRRWIDQDSDDFYDSPGPAIMEAWLRELLVRVLKDDVGEAFFYPFASPSYPTAQLRASWDSGVGIKLIVRNIETIVSGAHQYDFFNGQSPNRILAEAFAAARRQLIEGCGENLADWKTQVPSLKLSPYNYNGVPQTFLDSSIALSQMTNRGSENNFFIAGSKGIVGHDSYVPGQSGFIGAEGNKSDHYFDQIELYSSFKNKPLPLPKSAVEIMSKQSVEIYY